MADWVMEEFGTVELGDRRLAARLVTLAGALGAQPGASLPEACGDASATTAAYRFFNNPAVTPEALVAGHVRATWRRVQAVPLVLAVQDTTLLDWSHHPATTGLGRLARARQRGLLAHTTLAFTPEGVPLGLLAQAVWARDDASYGQLADHHDRPVAEKESQKWLTSLGAVITARQQCPDARFVSVGDREADVYDLFLAPRPPAVDLLVRATQDRATPDGPGRLWATVAAVPTTATATARVPARGEQPARTAVLTVRWCPVTLCPPSRRAKERLPTVTVWVVLAREEHPPSDAPAVEWLLLTTVPVTSATDALERLAWYACRWGIEVWHKVLKSGCRIEAKQLQDAARLQRCLALYSVIAWRILWATTLARTTPDLPCTVLLRPDEWQALYCRIHQTTVLPVRPPTVGQAVRWLAELGGYLARAGDGPPGATVLWRGFRHLTDLTAMYTLFRPPAQLCVQR